MEMPSDFKSALEWADGRSEELCRIYLRLACCADEPSIGRLVRSVIHQKTGQAEILKTVRESGEAARNPAVDLGLPPDVPCPAAEEPAAPALLKAIREGESGMADVYIRLLEASTDSENRQRLHALAETSRRFCAWARDHQELLSLF
ncbi:MAG TPA: hypothetical protein VLH39_02970 [Magnetospirillaceae bacterium]|nr:hypothetical protein [Magnetospirillaceae bacterium]